MLNKIIYFISLSFYFFCVIVISTLECPDSLADEAILVSVDGQDFDTKNFFGLEGMGFRKDKVNFDKGWLGIFMENVEGKGILVKEITQGSPAAEAGLKAGDIITKINNESTLGKDDLNLIQFKKTIESIGAGGAPVLTVSRDSGEMVFKPILFGKLLKNVTEPITPFISKVGHELTKEDRNTPPYEEGGGVENLTSGKEVKRPSNSKDTGMSFTEFAIKNERYREMLGAALQRIGEEAYVREGFQSSEDTNPFRLSIVNYFMLHPFDTPKIGQSIVNTFCSNDVCAQIRCAAELLDVTSDMLNIKTETLSSSPSSSGNTVKDFYLPFPSSPPCEGGGKGKVDKSPNASPDIEQTQKIEAADSLQGQLQCIIDSLAPCVSLIKESFHNLSQEEVEFLYQNAHKIWLPDEKIEPQGLARLLALSQKVDIAKLFEATSLLLSKLIPVFSEQKIDAAKKAHSDVLQTKVMPFQLSESLRCKNLQGISDEVIMNSGTPWKMKIPLNPPFPKGESGKSPLGKEGKGDSKGFSNKGIKGIRDNVIFYPHPDLPSPFSPPLSSSPPQALEGITGAKEKAYGDLSANRILSPCGRGLRGEDTELLQDFAGDILFVQDTAIGKIVVGGTGTSYYYADAAVIIDLGGNDYYFNNAGSSNKDVPASICIDFSGDDVYHATSSFSQGTGKFGVGLLIDFRGNDKYLGKDFSQGSCLFGVGLLMDNEGNDFYSGHIGNQGVGFFGAGLLNDLSGNDVFFSRQFAQGVGFTKGFGALMDSSGNDFYFAGGEYPDFRDPGKSFQSMSQGMGMGIRPEESIVGASGGIGILIDQKGTDQYHGDYFSQGSGYYYSLGVLCDNDGNDKYYAGRYAQGAGIHSAIGLLKDTSGDDTYACTFGVSQGCGHDTGIGFLVDDSGNDAYRSKTTSQGVGLEKGIGVLADFYGDDVYQANDNSQGVSSPSKTEEISGIGILIDNQGDHDTFHDPIAEKLLLYRTNGGIILNK
ncbi:MAG: PDZ domain-containing protein [Candidatus Brocadia sp.]